MQGIKKKNFTAAARICINHGRVNFGEFLPKWAFYSSVTLKMH